MRIQFLLKKNEVYSFVSYCRRSSGLWNSTQFIAKALAARGLEVDICELNDNNDIDRAVTRFKPHICVIEALWVVPEKFDVLKKLHPTVQWFCHMHSGLPFLALEGIAMDWLHGYVKRDVGIIANSKDTDEAFKAILPEDAVSFLPNVYLPNVHKSVAGRNRLGAIHIGCFGALRPMKNHLLQAIAAIKYANQIGKVLHFHVNSSRVETGGDPVLKNLRQLFEHQAPHKFVECDWMEPADFIDFLHAEIDIGMQVSMTETFNVVTADYVSAGLPVVTSPEVAWVSHSNHVHTHSVDDVVDKMTYVHHNESLVKNNQILLDCAGQAAIRDWLEWANDVYSSSFERKSLNESTRR